MKMPKFGSMKALGAAAVIVAASSLTGCGYETVSQGNFALEKPWMSGAYEVSKGDGPHMRLFGTVDEGYGKEEMIKVDNIHPKDKDNVLLKDLDLVVTYKANPDKMVKFYAQTGDMTESSKDGAMHFGLARVDRDARATIGESVRKYSSLDILNNPQRLESTFKDDLQKQLDMLYGKNTFIVTNVKVANIQVADSIEARIQNIALIDAETQKNNATMTILASRQKVLTAELGTFKKAAEGAGMTVDQALEYETLKAVQDGAQTRISVGSSPKPGK